MRTPTQLVAIRAELRAAGDPERAIHSRRFFKTGKGEYAEGDRFLGVTVPDQRRIVARYRDLALKEILTLLHSPIHEERLTALLILTAQYPRATSEQQEVIARTYLSQTKWINNWDLVDCTAPRITGAHLLKRSRSVLRRFAKSKNLWERRIAIISTLAFISKGDFKETFTISKILMHDSHDLIHKAVGWMLREVGKRDLQPLDTFLKEYADRMPRTMLRYAIEKYPQKKRMKYLAMRNTHRKTLDTH